MSDLYMKMCKDEYRQRLKEKNDCAVIAAAIACRTDYKTTHKTMWFNGRRDRRGTSQEDILQTVADLGCVAVELGCPKQKTGSRYTPKTISKKYPNGYYIVLVNEHIFALVNGVVQDWTEGRRHRIEKVWKVTKTRRS